MNIEIANRLVQLRKQNNLSQEALAEKLGISRQAVSKWERAEASPDTDNIILLARLYGVSLDELLQTEDEIPRPELDENVEESVAETVDADKSAEPVTTENTYGIVESTETSVAPVREMGGNEVVAGLEMKKWKRLKQLPFALMIAVLYVILGACFNAWHPAWLLFMLIPIWDSLLSSIIHRNPMRFAYPVAAALLYLCVGFFLGWWHPGWVVFLTIPLYYPLVRMIFDKE